PFDIAPFALPNTPSNEIRFEEWRDITTVEVEFEHAPPEGLTLAYLQKTWPERRWELDAQHMDPARLGWGAIDDWFNPKWQPAAVNLELAGNRAVFTFTGLNAEFPDADDYNVTFRRTLGLRIDTPDPEAIRRSFVFTASPAGTTSLRITLDAGQETPAARLCLGGYNLTVPDEFAELDMARERGRLITVHHMTPERSLSGDDPLLTVRLADDAFTVNLMDLAAQGPIWFEDMGVFITHADDDTSFDHYRKQHAHAKTLTQQVLDRPEQSLAGAYHGQPRPHCVNFAVGCKHARQRFRIEPNGDIDLEAREFADVPGKDTDRIKQAFTARFLFGLERWRIFARFPDPDPVL
ncbi:MAG: hypothetical protein GY851_16950, partial [bacterium]|nr:hypothetical protein [bacterium]